MNEGTAITAAIKKANTSIDKLLDEYKAQPAETAGRVEAAEGDVDYSTLLRKLEEYLYLNGIDYGDAGAAVKALDTVLLPEQINRFIQMARKFECEIRRDMWHTGTFISKLVQNSYDAGHNDFILNQEELPEMAYVAINLQGTEENPIRLKITGKTGPCCAWGARYIILEAQEAGYLCGAYARKSTFIVKRTGEKCGKEAQQSTFRTADQETLWQLYKSVDTCRGNKIEFISNDGKGFTREV